MIMIIINLTAIIQTNANNDSNNNIGTKIVLHSGSYCKLYKSSDSNKTKCNLKDSQSTSVTLMTLS